MSLGNSYSCTIPLLMIIKVAKHFCSILSTEFCEEEFWIDEEFGNEEECGFWLALNVFPSSLLARDYQIQEGLLLAHKEENASFCINIFFSVAMAKTLPHLKQWQPTPIVSTLCLESVRIVSRYKVHKRPKIAVAFETSLLLAKPKGYLTFHRQHFSMGAFL